MTVTSSALEGPTTGAGVNEIFLAFSTASVILDREDLRERFFGRGVTAKRLVEAGCMESVECLV